MGFSCCFNVNVMLKIEYCMKSGNRKKPTYKPFENSHKIHSKRLPAKKFVVNQLGNNAL